MLWLVTTALAHSPHDVCGAVARQADGTVLAGARADLARFAPDGTLAAHLSSPDAPRCLAGIGDAAWVLVTEDDRAWRSTDDGASWELLEPAASACAQGPDGALIGGLAGTWRVGPTRLETLDDRPVVAVAHGPDGALALGTDGALLSVESGATVLDAGPWRAIASDGVDVLLANRLGVARWDGTLSLAGGPPDAVVLAIGPGAWLAAGAEGGIWESRDRGDNWHEETDGLEPQEDGGGSPGDGVYWASLLVDEIGWLAAAWEGLYVHDPDASRWVQRETYTLPMVRTLQWGTEGSLLIAPYGSGLAQGTPGDTDWRDVSTALGWPWVRTLLATEGGAGSWFLSAGSHIFQSADAGATWSVVVTGNTTDGDVVAVGPDWPADPTIWSGGQDADGKGVALFSPDAGVSWEYFVLDGCRGKPSALLAETDAAWIACGDGIWSLSASGALALLLPHEAANEVVAIQRDGDALIFAGAGGVWRHLPAGSELLVDGRIRALAAVPEEAGTDAVRFVLATDAGLASWDGVGEPVSLGWPVDDLVASLAISPDGRWAAGTRRGAYVSDDGGLSWLLATDVDRYDDRDRTFWYEEGWRDTQVSGAKAGNAAEGGPGAVAEWWLEATALALRARGPGVLQISVDGGEAEEITLADESWRTAWSAALPPGLHALRIEVVSGTVQLDGGKRWRNPGALPPPPDDDVVVHDGCGCGGAGGRPAGALVVVAVAAAVVAGRRRRHRARAATTEARS
jgi:hypothetical protein